MHNTYVILIVIASIILGFISSARVGYTLAGRWGYSGGEQTFFSIFSGICAAVLIGYMSNAAIQLGGLIGGFIGVALTVPVVGFCWIYLVGGNKAFERIIDRLVKRID